MTNNDALLTHAIQPGSVRPDPSNPNLTIPASFGVYEIRGTDRGPSSHQYRIGNYRVRLIELKAEFGRVHLYARFKERELAVQLAASLNRQ